VVEEIDVAFCFNVAMFECCTATLKLSNFIGVKMIISPKKLILGSWI